MLDAVKLALIVNLAALSIVIITTILLAWNNVGSRNLALATGTLLAASVLYVIQLPFELRRTTERDRVTTEFTVDRAKPKIRQWLYVSPGERIGAEVGASEWLAQRDAGAFERDREKLTSDFMIVSLIRFLGFKEFDWQLRRVTFGGISGTIGLTQGVSKPHECTEVTHDELASQLERASNLFAGSLGRMRSLCLPPNSIVELTERSLVIRNPLCSVAFDVELPGSVMFMKPTGGAHYETRPVGLNVETTYHALRANHRDIAKYRDWCERLVSDAHDWFES